MNGVINVYKEPGWTSGDVVNKLKGVLHERRIGHAGTLDPDAEGVLPVCVGQATRLFDFLTSRHKTYQARVRFGITTDTQDASGTVLAEKTPEFSEEQLLAACQTFVGCIKQIPPMYSALRQGGKRLYELARQGQEVTRAPREIEIESIAVLTPVENNECSLRVVCGKGTYIRTLCEDLGNALGCGAHMRHLLRESAGGLCLEDALPVAEIQKRAAAGDFSFLLPMDQAVSFLPAVEFLPEAEKKLQNGNPVEASFVQKGGAEENEFVRLYCRDVFFGIGARRQDVYRIQCRLGGGGL